MIYLFFEKIQSINSLKDIYNNIPNINVKWWQTFGVKRDIYIGKNHKTEPRI